MRLRIVFLLFLIGGAIPVHAQTGSKFKIVALGDSTTAGTPGFCSPQECPPHGQGDEESQYAYWVMKKHPDWEVINRGVNGERSDQILKRFDADVLSHQPQTVIVLAGVNDLYQGAPVEFIQKNLNQIYERARQAGIRVLACSVIPYNFSTPEVKQKMNELNAWIRRTSTEKENAFCDTYKALEDPAKPGHLLSSPDGLHPDTQGYQKMGEAITACLESMKEGAYKTY